MDLNILIKKVQSLNKPIIIIVHVESSQTLKRLQCCSFQVDDNCKILFKHIQENRHARLTNPAEIGTWRW